MTKKSQRLRENADGISRRLFGANDTTEKTSASSPEEKPPSNSRRSKVSAMTKTWENMIRAAPKAVVEASPTASKAVASWNRKSQPIATKKNLSEWRDNTSTQRHLSRYFALESDHKDGNISTSAATEAPQDNRDEATYMVAEKLLSAIPTNPTIDSCSLPTSTDTDVSLSRKTEKCPKKEMKLESQNPPKYGPFSNSSDSFLLVQNQSFGSTMCQQNEHEYLVKQCAVLKQIVEVDSERMFQIKRVLQLQMAINEKSQKQIKEHKDHEVSMKRSIQALEEELEAAKQNHRQQITELRIDNQLYQMQVTQNHIDMNELRSNLQQEEAKNKQLCRDIQRARAQMSGSISSLGGGVYQGQTGSDSEYEEIEIRSDEEYVTEYEESGSPLENFKQVEEEIIFEEDSDDIANERDAGQNEELNTGARHEKMECPETPPDDDVDKSLALSVGSSVLSLSPADIQEILVCISSRLEKLEEWKEETESTNVAALIQEHKEFTKPRTSSEIAYRDVSPSSSSEDFSDCRAAASTDSESESTSFRRSNGGDIQVANTDDTSANSSYDNDGDDDITVATSEGEQALKGIARNPHRTSHDHRHVNGYHSEWGYCEPWVASARQKYEEIHQQ